MKLLTHPATVALGVATLCLLARIGSLVSPAHRAIYHLSGTASGVFVGAFVALGVLWLLLTPLLLLARKPGRLRGAIWSGITLALPWIVLKNCTQITGWAIPHWISPLISGVALAAFLGLMIFWRPSLASAFEHVQQFMTTILGFAAISGIIVVGQLLWFGWQARNLNAALPLHQRQQASSVSVDRKRIIWIVLDELSYQQVYERRYPGLQLPAFDRFGAQSTIFTHVIPAGMFTEDVLPSLLTGGLVASILASSDGHLAYVRSPGSGSWRTFDQHNTVFQDALDAGYSTGIAGWYNPYCRILPQVLDHCFWVQRLPRIDGIAIDHSVAVNAGDILQRLSRYAKGLRVWERRVPEVDAFGSEAHIEDYRDLLAAGDRLLGDSSANFILLHMPVPHPSGIYNRTTGEFTTGSATYIDNLALADSYLAHVRIALERLDEWGSSAVVVMGDHSWRTHLLNSQPAWTDEEQLASHGGQFDDRPAYIVKLPHQQQAARIDIPYAAIHTRAMLDAMLADRINTSSDLAAWAQQQR